MSGDKGVAVRASPAALLHGTILLLQHLQQPFIHPFSPKRSCCVSFGMPGGLLASSHPAVSTVWTCLWWGHRGLCASSWGTHGVGLPQQQGLGEHRGLRSLLPRGCHQQSTRPQGGWEKPPEKLPVRREAAGPRRLGLWDKKSLRWLCWLFVDSSWLSWGLKATLKLSKQTLISQFSQPACNLSLALLYRGGGAAPSCGNPSALSTRSSSGRGTAKGRGLELSPCHSITCPSLIKHPASSRDWHRQALGQGEGGMVPDGAERRGKCPTP